MIKYLRILLTVWSILMAVTVWQYAVGNLTLTTLVLLSLAFIAYIGFFTHTLRQRK